MECRCIRWVKGGGQDVDQRKQPRDLGIDGSTSQAGLNPGNTFRDGSVSAIIRRQGSGQVPALCGDTCLDARTLERPSKEGFPGWPIDIYVE